MITVTINDICVTLWDTPGLKDPFSDGEKAIKEIREKCDIRDIDLFVYCTRFDQTRLGQDDVDCIRDITKAFGDGIWKRALFALTFANKATIPPSSDVQSLQEYFQSCEEQWSEGLHRVVRENVDLREIPVGKIDSIPVIATGYRGLPLPDGRNWFTDFWEACLLQVKFFTIPALIRATGDRVKGKLERAVTARVIGQRCADIGDGITQELKAEIMRTDSSEQQETHVQLPQVVATAQWSDMLIEATQSNQPLTRQLARGIGHTLTQHKLSLLIAGIAALCVLYLQYYSK